MRLLSESAAIVRRIHTIPHKCDIELSELYTRNSILNILKIPSSILHKGSVYTQFSDTEYSDYGFSLQGSKGCYPVTVSSYLNITSSILHNRRGGVFRIVPFLLTIHYKCNIEYSDNSELSELYTRPRPPTLRLQRTLYWYFVMLST